MSDIEHQSIPWKDGYFAYAEYRDKAKITSLDLICPYSQLTQWESAQEWIKGWMYRSEKECDGPEEIRRVTW